MGAVTDFDNFMGAVIDQKSFDRISGYVEGAKKGADTKIIAGGKCDDRWEIGYFFKKNTTFRESCI